MLCLFNILGLCGTMHEPQVTLSVSMRLIKKLKLSVAMFRGSVLIPS